MGIGSSYSYHVSLNLYMYLNLEVTANFTSYISYTQ